MRKVRIGSVVRTRTDKTAVVEAVWKQRHRLYRKQMRRVARYHVHDPLNQCQLGDLVRIEETRPISKTKRWRLLAILESRQVVEVRPIELESDVEDVLPGSGPGREELVEEPAAAAAARPVIDAETDDGDEARLLHEGPGQGGLAVYDEEAAPLDGAEPGQEDPQA